MLFRTAGVITASWMGDVTRVYMRNLIRPLSFVTAGAAAAAGCMLFTGAWPSGLFAAAMAAGLGVYLLRAPALGAAQEQGRFAARHGTGEVTLTVWFSQGRMHQQFSDGCEASFALDQIRRVDDLGPVWVLTLRGRRLAVLFADQLSEDEQRQLIRLLRDHAPSANLPVI